MPEEIETVHTYSTPFNADSVEWCPQEPFQHVFVCANYQLQEPLTNGVCERIGCILLFALSPTNLNLLQTIKVAGVLDQKWCHNQINGCSILGVVTSKKTLEVYRLNVDLLQLELLTCYKFNDCENEGMLLSLDWSTGKFSCNEPELVCSDSKGSVHRFKLKAELVKLETLLAHEFEAWIAAFYYWDPNIFFSGGDDCYFLKFDQRTGPQPVSRSRNHEAGVTSMHSNVNREYIVATGSYDTNVRLWDVRYLKNCTNSIQMPETVWRLKWDPFQANFLLIACMLGGAHIVNTTKSDVTRSYNYHTSIVYGVDWCHTVMDSFCYISSCSFYDNLLCVSKVKIK